MSEPQATVQEATQAAVRLLSEQAANHKRLQQHHRREAQRIRFQIEQIKQHCLAVGITVDDEPEATSHGHRTEPRS